MTDKRNGGEFEIPHGPLDVALERRNKSASDQEQFFLELGRQHIGRLVLSDVLELLE
jgi:hypothetical protein